MLGLAAALATLPAVAEEAPAGTFKTAGAFLSTCDARPDAAGERPPANIPCLSYVAGLIDGYTAAAIANGNARPYCLPRPVTLVEMTDMLAEVIARGLPPTMPTAAVFHILLQENFACGGGDAPPAGTPEEKTE